MSLTVTKEINPEMTMGEILSNYPSAKRALFQKYHIGGCSSCGYSLDESLAVVMLNHRREKEVSNAIQYIYESAEVDRQLQLTPTELKSKLDSGEEIFLIDVREDWEIETAKLPNSQVITQKLAYEILNKWDKNSQLVFYCHSGIRSLEAASYFKGHGMPNVKSLMGGIDRYSLEVDPSIPRY
ncbi:MAG: rhodanese-like domain-containing protein [Leptospiraceae bacterium]|nr:rhodanese-like domain-containing protein [Leptospiraceae bacterium]